MHDEVTDRVDHIVEHLGLEPWVDAEPEGVVHGDFGVRQVADGSMRDALVGRLEQECAPASRASTRRRSVRSVPIMTWMAVDPENLATAVTLMGVDPGRVAYLREAGKFLGQADLDRIEQRGDDVERSAVHFTPAPGFERLSI